MTPKEKVYILPDSPGVYRFYDESGKIIYIGKAKSLKKRVSQYFQKADNLSPKNRVMVSKIRDVQHTVVESEVDALLLENNLIKEFQPRYNILLKDGKTYPWIVIKKERFPRIFTTRNFIRDGSLYFGPYSSAMHARNILEIINSLYKLRSCNLKIEKTAVEKDKFKICLNYHIKRCMGPCVSGCTEEEYNNQINEIQRLLKGETAGLIREYKEKMKVAAKELDFENAHILKSKIDILEKHYSRSLIVHPSIDEIDVFSIVLDQNEVFGNFLRIKSGCIIQSYNAEFKLGVEESESKIMSFFIGDIYSKLGDLSKEIIVSHLPEEEILGKDIKLALKGDKLNLLKLSIKNANALKFEKLKYHESINPEEYTKKILEKIKSDLQLSKLPVWIECFDNSNIQGTNPVAACVVFKNAKPSKKDYRHFDIKTVIGANDFASMFEVLTRRYSRLKEEGNGFPQLIVVDGGRGQLNFAYQALQQIKLEDKIEIVGIAKRLEEIIIPGDPTPLFLDKNSSTLKILMYLRNEAHRFGITHHRAKRSKSQITSKLRAISGVGDAVEEKLLRHFRSVKKVKEASEEEIANIVGPSIAKKIKEQLK